MIRLLLIGITLWAAGVQGDPIADVRVKRVTVEGTRQFEPDEVSSWMITRRGSIVKRETIVADARRVLEKYEGEGYWHARVTVEGPDGEGGLRWRVVEGEPTHIDSIVLMGDTVFPDVVLRSALSLRSGSPLIPDDLHEDLQGLLTLYERSGHPYASIEPQISVAADAPTAVIELTIDPGPHVTIDGVRFSGLNGTSQQVLMRTTGLKVGATYDRRAVEGATRALRGLPYLARVGDAELEQDVRTGRYWVHFSVEEMPSTRIEGAFGLLPGSADGHRLTGLVNAEALNLLGTGRQLSVFWQRPEPFSSDLRFHYREPYVANVPLDATVTVTMAERDGYAESRAEAGLGYHPAPGVSVSASGGRAAVRPDSLGLGAIADRSAWVTTAAIRLNRVDNIWNARAGYRADAVLNLDRWRATRSGPATDRLRVSVDAMRLLPAGRRSVVMASIHGRHVRQRGGPTVDALWRLGGSESIRGYVEEQFLADSAGWAKLEWRRLIGPRARAFVFTDVGMLRGTDGEWLSPLGYGVGIQSTVRSGDVRVEYALSKDDVPAKGKVHVRLISTF